MKPNEASPDLIKNIAELYYKSKDMSTTQSGDLAKQFCVTIKHAQRALIILTQRKFLLKIGGQNGSATWMLNPDYPGTLADAIHGNKGPFQGVAEKEYPKDFGVAGPAYKPAPSKTPWEHEYYTQLMSLKKAAELSRK